MIETFIYPSRVETARGLLLYLLEQIARKEKTTFSDGIFHLALSGGSTPALMFDLWASEYKETTPWERLRLYWVDERCVPPQSADSNYGMTYSYLLEHVPIPDGNVFRIHGENNPQEEAERYSELVRRQLPSKDGWPVFDLVLLGAGDDGHTSSIFPGQDYLLTSDALYAVSRHPVTGQQRIALTGQPILAARDIAFLVTGKSKARVVRDICQAEDAGPAAYIARRAKRGELFGDEEAFLVES